MDSHVEKTQALIEAFEDAVVEHFNIDAPASVSVVGLDSHGAQTALVCGAGARDFGVDPMSPGGGSNGSNLDYDGQKRHNFWI